VSTWDYEDNAHLPEQERLNLEMEATYGEPFVKYKGVIGQTIQFQTPRLGLRTGKVIWVSKTWVRLAGQRRTYVPEYFVQEQDSVCRVFSSQLNVESQELITSILDGKVREY
jgi:hypothetical protein